ncbi:epidermal differentiation-specific protein-like [Denticeps clupeoides]|uniref:epidermal differentiation-specific protein-like n=1 Tax=Denticeps clupeoides TaxID=299321 RepID=UPI0010A36A63|nr:epidermal differentiation-specific protein-like [Denticeps clupeoides]XP_028822401.1 epidermal differentiation-specific protein-like [Denticeps clupeoides]
MASNPVNKIFVYENPDFQGVSREFTEYCPDLRDVSFNDCISSVKVIGQPWVLYEHPHCQGAQFYFEEGECRSVEWHEVISSLEQVKEDLTNPQITLYEDQNYGGRSITLNCETNLMFGNFNDMISSCRVDRGAWVLYEHPNRGGRSILVRAGREFPNIGWIDNQVSWARPLKPGRPKITAELLWDKKEENTKSVVIDSICGVNRGKHEQTFSSELSREYEGSVTESFNFSNATQISVGMSFGFDIGIVKSEVNVNVSNTFTVEKGTSNTKTEKKGVKISIPATIHPHTKLTVNVVRKEVDVKVPVKITIQSGYSSSTEYGEYRCQAGNTILAEYQEEDI